MVQYALRMLLPSVMLGLILVTLTLPAFLLVFLIGSEH